MASPSWEGIRARAGRALDAVAVGRVAALAARPRAERSEAAAELLGRLVGPLLDSPDLGPGLTAAALDRLWPEDRPSPQVPAADGPIGARIEMLFHRLYYHDERGTWRSTAYRGVHIEKCPLDLWQYMEIVGRLAPDLVIETDAKGGGTALLLADLCDSLGNGRVVTMGVEDDPDWPRHPRITYWHADPADPVIVRRAAALAGTAATTLVFANSSHRAETVHRELETYGPLVSPGSYLIVENTNIHGHPVRADLPAGPMEAVRRFVAGSEEFEVDRERESHRLTFNPSGYLRRRIPEE